MSQDYLRPDDEEDRFPRILLTRPPRDRAAYFDDYTIKHTVIADVFATLCGAIEQPAGASVLAVVGPTGIGKSTLRRALEKHLGEQMRHALEQDPGRLAVCSLTAPNPDTGSFKWKDYWIRLLQALDEPLIDHKRADDPWGQRRTDRTHPAVPHGADAAALRRAVEQAMKHRKLSVCLIDEAQHLAKVASTVGLANQMDTLKSLADASGTVHVLFGTYPLLGSLTALHGQVIRRTRYIPFRRYHAEVSTDRRDFQMILRGFQQNLPLREEPDLVSIWAYCYERSLGIVGLLKGWLLRGLSAALREEAATLTRRHLEREALSAPDLLTILAEAESGEERLSETADDVVRLQQHLRLPRDAALPRSLPPADGPLCPKTEDEAPPARWRRSRPGDRRPQRDPIGAPPDAQ